MSTSLAVALPQPKRNIYTRLPDDPQKVKLLLSSSSLATFKRCRKSYLYGYEWNLDPQLADESGPMREGRDFHALVAAVAEGREIEDDMSESYPVAIEYLKHRPLPPRERIMLVEPPSLYTRLLPGVFIRTTFDLVYLDENGVIVIRDYKTFDKAPTDLDVDLDFQARFYSATIMLRYDTDKVRFEHERVRRVPPGTPNSRGKWSVDECYIPTPALVISREEALEIWEESQEAAREILRLKRRQNERAWYRTELLAGKAPYTCGNCHYRVICNRDLFKEIDRSEPDSWIEVARIRKPLELPQPEVK